MLPLLASAYNSGRLVPFIGAGMSRQKVVGWDGFVVNLEKAAKLPPGRGEHLEVRAQRAAAMIRRTGSDDDFFNAIRQSLKDERFDELDLPAQTAALSAIYWPLTISTNYDDLFYTACRKAFETRLEPLVLGRSASDCKRVMSSLVSPFDREIVWHIQGFLGGQGSKFPLKRDRELLRLHRELVIGHSEYRKVTNTAIHFRRCFGEVFRTRSLLFLGSSLSEEYFWNLFGEMLELCGPSPVPHFALLPKSVDVDIRFLAEEMNITILQYKHYEELPDLLAHLKKLIDDPSARVSRWTLDTKKGPSLEITPHAPLPIPGINADFAVAVVVRTDSKGRFQIEPDQEELRARFRNQSFSRGKHVVSPAPGLFAVRARAGNPNETDSIGTAVEQLLSKVDRRRRVVHMHLPAEGGTVPPVYGFIEAIRAYGSWARGKNARELRLVVYVGPQVILNLTSHQIDLEELLTSRLIRFWTAVNETRTPAHHDHDGNSDREPIQRVLYKTPKTKLSDVLVEVLGNLGETALKTWSVSLSPSPRHEVKKEVVTAQSVADCSLCDVGVVFGSVLTLNRIASKPRPEPLRKAAAVSSGQGSYARS